MMRSRLEYEEVRTQLFTINEENNRLLEVSRARLEQLRKQEELIIKIKKKSHY